MSGINFRTFFGGFKKFFKKLLPRSIKNKTIYGFLIPVLLIYAVSSYIEINARIDGLREKTELIMNETASEMVYRVFARSASVSASVVTLADSYSFLPNESFVNETGIEESVYRIVERVLSQSDIAIYGAGIALNPDTFGKPSFFYVKTDKTNNKLQRLDYSHIGNKSGQPYFESDWYKFLESNYLEVQRDRLGIWFRPFLNHENYLLLHCSFPIVRNEKFVGIVTVDISLDDLRSQLCKNIPQEGIVIRMLDPTGHFFMVGSGEEYLIMGNTFLATALEQNNKPLCEAIRKVSTGLRGDEIATVTCRDFTGGKKDIMAVLAPLSERVPGWILMATIPLETINAPVVKQIWRSLMFTAFFASVIGLIGIVISRSIRRSLKKLSYFADELRKGKYNAKFEGRLFDKKDELGNLARSFKSMAKAVVGRRKKLEHMQIVLIHALSSLAEYRDPETGSHIRRTAIYAELLATEARKRDLLSTGIILRQQMGESVAKIIARAAPLHDIGKVAIPDSVLLKPDKLTKEEFELMKGHVNYGVRTLRLVIREIKEPSFLNIALDICAGHHERYDGKGYPNGLCGSEIPLAGRIMAIVDVYDAVTTDRSYKKAFDHETAVNIIKEGSGTQFDPQLVDCFLAVSDEFAKIAQECKDEEQKFMDSAVR